MADIKTQDFSAASAISIQDPILRQALIKVGTGFDSARLDAIQDVTPAVWDAWRDEARRIKIHTLDHLDYYLDLLEQNVAKAGGQVHFASDAAEANAIVAAIAQSGGVKIVTKGKSMVSEELSLNPVLESIGVEVFETDLGEYIIQLAGETPSHLVAPALHKTKEQVAQLFSDKLGLPRLESIEDMAKAAREVLRGKFLQADMGISGGFIVVEPHTNREWFGDLRSWPFDRWQALVARLRAARPELSIVQVGLDDGVLLDGAVDLRGRSTFREAAMILRRSDLFIGTESGLMHAANAVDARAIIIWGGVTLPEFAGYPDQQKVLCSYVDCAPCGQFGWCDNDHVCMRSIGVNAVFDAVMETIPSTNA